MPRTSTTVTMIGAGLNGPLLATSLVKRGFRVEIYERRPDMRRAPMTAGRSINLALSTRGIHALAEAGLWDAMRQIIIPMKGRMMHPVSGALTFQPYGKDDAEVIYSISRATLADECSRSEGREVTLPAALYRIRFENRNPPTAP